MPPAPQVVVRTIPESGRKSLYVASHAGRIFGMPEHESRALIDQLIAHATQRQFVYTHRWRVNDLVMWDNRCTMHRGTEFDDLRWKRDVQRATVSDIANSCEQKGIEIAAAWRRQRSRAIGRWCLMPIAGLMPICVTKRSNQWRATRVESPAVTLFD